MDTTERGYGLYTPDMARQDWFWFNPRQNVGLIPALATYKKEY